MENAEFALACEQVLAESLTDVATELRLVNVIDLIGYVQAQHCANLEDLVNPRRNSILSTAPCVTHGQPISGPMGRAADNFAEYGILLAWRDRFFQSLSQFGARRCRYSTSDHWTKTATSLRTAEMFHACHSRFAIDPAQGAPARSSSAKVPTSDVSPRLAAIQTIAAIERSHRSGYFGAHAQTAPMAAANENRRRYVLDQFHTSAAEIAWIGLAQEFLGVARRHQPSHIVKNPTVARIGVIPNRIGPLRRRIFFVMNGQIAVAIHRRGKHDGRVERENRLLDRRQGAVEEIERAISILRRIRIGNRA